MNHDQIILRNAKQLASIKRKIAKLVKSIGCSTGEVLWGQSGFEHWVQVENDGKLGDYISDIIAKAPTAQVLNVEEHDGQYMWSADHYVRPVSVVTFKF